MYVEIINTSLITRKKRLNIEKLIILSPSINRKGNSLFHVFIFFCFLLYFCNTSTAQKQYISLHTIRAHTYPTMMSFFSYFLRCQTNMIDGGWVLKEKELKDGPFPFPFLHRWNNLNSHVLFVYIPVFIIYFGFSFRSLITLKDVSSICLQI